MHVQQVGGWAELGWGLGGRGHARRSSWSPASPLSQRASRLANLMRMENISFLASCTWLSMSSTLRPLRQAGARAKR